MIRYALVAALLLPCPIAAQSTLFLKAGPVISTVAGDDVTGAESSTGIAAGVALDIATGGNLSVMVGAQYIQKGADISDPDISASVNLDYFEFPLLLKFGIPSEGSVGAHVLLGPVVGFEINCSADASGSGASVSADCSQIDAATKSIDVGAMGGLGVDIAASPSLTVSIATTYTLGLTSIDDEGGDTKNRAFAAMLGIGFPIG